MITSRTQRWRDRRCRWIPNATEIDPRRLAVDVINTRAQATPFVKAHHYSGSMPVTRLSVGLFANGKGGHSELVGVCVFSHPVNDASVPKSAGLSDPRTACDLGRLVIVDSQGGNAESYLLARAFRILRKEKPEIISVISYADPNRRIDMEGNIIVRGHIGGLYSTLGARYTGRTRPRFELVMPDGRLISSRAISKIRNAECGQRYAIQDLLDAGARPPRFGEDMAGWLAELECSGFLRKVRHAGNHAYLFPLTKAARIAARKVPSLSYPLLDREVMTGDVTALPLLARAA